MWLMSATNLIVWVSVLAVCVPTVTGNNYVAVSGIKFVGTLLHTLKAQSLVVCGSICQAKSCPGFSVAGTFAPFDCSVYSTITSYVEDVTAKDYYDGASPPWFIYKGQVVLVYPGDSPELTYSEAKAWCAEQNAQMFIPKSTEDWTWMHNIANESMYYYIWIPANDADVEGTLRWEDGTNAMNSDVITWAPYEPLDETGDYDWVIAEVGFDTLEGIMISADATADSVICQRN